MNKRSFFFLICLLFASLQGFGQVPVIQKIERPVSFNKATLTITGSGFSSNSAQLQVWFDHIKGIIKSSTEFSIEVEVPPQAKLDNIRVVNLTSKLSAQSDLKFMPVYSGEGFAPAKLEPKTYPSTSAVFDMISIDVDGDNRPDIVGTRNDATSTTMALLMNQSTIGNINFIDTPIPSLNINAPTAFLATGDINGDGKPDVVASRDGNTTNLVYVLINTSTVGNPSFSAPIILSLDTNIKALQLEIEDLNNDGRPEIIVANGTTNELYIFKNESNGGSTNINTTPVKVAVTGASETLALEIQDLDRDGKKDIVVSRFQSPDLYILKNNSTNTSFNFTITKITSAGSYRDLASVDFNNDGKLDLIAISIFTAQANVFLNQSTATAIAFSPFPITVATDAQPFNIDVSDLNGDGFADFIVASRGVATLTAFISNGNTSALGFSKVVITTNKTNWAVRASDLDGDAKPDIAFTSFTGSGPTGSYSVDILKNINCHKPRILNDSPLNICGSQTIRLNAIPMPGVTYSWSNGFTTFKTGADAFADVTVAATYTVTATRSEGTGCSVVSNAIVINAGAGSAPAEPVITTNAPICASSTLTLSTTAISGATYNWTGPNNFTANLQSVSIPNATVANAGVYSLTVKVGDCTSNRATKTIDIISAGSFAISSTSSTNTICEGQSLTLSVNSETGYTYQWLRDNTNISGQTGTTLTVAQGGVYKVKVTNTALGCAQETGAVTVTVLKVPVASFTMPASGCVGNSISFTNTTVTETTPVLAWDFGDSGTSSLAAPSHTYTTANTFAVKLTVSYSGVTGCTNSVTKNLVIGTPTTPVISATLSELCEGEESTLSVSGTFDKYAWSTNETTPTIKVTAPGEYSVTTTELNTCIGNASFTITAKTDCPILNPELKFPPVFTPNGDTNNDRWVILGVDQFGDCTMNIFDGAGRRVFQVTGYPIEGWDGIYEGKEVPEGTYYFVFGCPNEKPQTGSVLIVR